MFSNLKRTADMVESTDTLGGGSYILESGVYKAKVASCYVEFSKGGAQMIQLKLTVAKPDGTTQDFSERLVVTNREGVIYYKGKDGKNHALPGYEMFEDLCLLTVGKLPSDLGTEKKVLPIFNYELGKEVPTEVDCVVDLLGQEVLAGIVKVRRNKQVADATGQYIDSADERVTNELRKLFHADFRTTVVEMRKAEQSGQGTAALKAEFIDKWEERNAGKLIDLYKEVVGASAAAGFGGKTAAPASAGSMVFGKRSA